MQFIIDRTDMSSDKHQILEPITAVSRLITLAFKPKNTKIAIRDHKVMLCEPVSEVYYGFNIPQGFGRYWNGDSREDIYILNHVLCNFIEWYIIPHKESDPDIYKGMINMAKYLRVGLKELQNTYKTGNAVCTIQYYIILLTSVIEGWFYSSLLYNPSSSERKSFLDDDDLESDSIIYSTIFDVQKFKHFWSKEELRSLCSQFDKCFRSPDEPDPVVFKVEDMDGIVDLNSTVNKNDQSTVDTIANETSILEKDANGKSDNDNIGELINIDALINNGHDSSKQLIASTSPITISTTSIKRINKTRSPSNMSSISNIMKSTNLMGSYSEDRIPGHSKIWPVPKSQSNVIVQGHLVGIANILNMMDRRFTTMLSQSVKGTH